MEIIQIKSAHSLITSITDARQPGAFEYKVNCRQFLSLFKSWQRAGQTEAHPLDVMTLDYVRIWITEAEGKDIASAIQSAHSPITFD